MSINDRILTLNETADILKVHWQTVRTYIKEGVLKSNKVGRNIRILESDLNAFISSKNTNQTEYELELRFLPVSVKNIEINLLNLDAKVIYHGHLIDHWFVPNSIKNMEDKNEWYDNGKGYGVRIREQDNGYTGKYTTTLEIKRLLIPNKHDSCIEHSIDVSSYGETSRLLSLMNFKEYTTLDKDRKVYKFKDFKIAIDNIKDFKTGIEIELVTTEPREKILPILFDIAIQIGLDPYSELVEKSVTFLAMNELAKY